MTSLGIKSIIPQPAGGSSLKSQAFKIKGAAWAGETEVIRVEISADGGARGEAAQLGKPASPLCVAALGIIWTAPKAGDFTILSRATDSQGRTQPKTPVWNPSGYLYNAIDQVKMHVLVLAGSAFLLDGCNPLSGRFDHCGPLPRTPRRPNWRRFDRVHRMSRISHHRPAALSKAWTREVDKMIKWGALVDSNDRNAFIRLFLASTFLPTRRPSQAKGLDLAGRNRTSFSSMGPQGPAVAVC